LRLFFIEAVLDCWNPGGYIPPLTPALVNSCVMFVGGKHPNSVGGVLSLVDNEELDDVLTAVVVLDEVVVIFEDGTAAQILASLKSEMTHNCVIHRGCWEEDTGVEHSAMFVPIHALSPAVQYTRYQ